jgi:predicted amidophosphoribosyltransferase
VDRPGFGACGCCPLRDENDALACWACASADVTLGGGAHCGVCDHPLAEGSPCPNYWCQRDDRGFDVLWAMGLHAGRLRRVIAAYKYRGGQAWASILGRLVAGYLLEHSPWFEEFDLITPCPGGPPSGRGWDHVGAIVDAAAGAIDSWPFDLASPRAVVKTVPTVALMSVGSPASRRLWAACELRPALQVPQPSRVRGRQVLVLDDVFTDGCTLREVALVLRRAGAAGVSGLVLARQPWRSVPE